eukprot:TRINITY_DN22354_c0_g1_i1.p1 TRINITY_DN22354_c0_g1~~TRINITY_DN22354_c0_g1_i1.p1  ORF type:complete len:138 (-),score=32.21 TRINITY_DN22354_c0_g1_i1:553-966(-)
MQWYQERGHNTIGFMPDYMLDWENATNNTRMKRAGLEVAASKLPDDVGLLERLVDEGLIIATPPQDYDDSYSIAYAKSHGGFVVTNDRFKDWVEKAQGYEDRESRKQWVRTHCCSYTFVNDEFIPNPDFKIPRLPGS